jgi:steroid 5-alpha reductase family enzyme
LGAEADVRLLSPLPLWTGILAGPAAWAVDLTVSYALVKWTCMTDRQALLHLFTLVSLGGVALGAILSWRALRQSADARPTDGGQPRQRAHFMAVLGLTSCALFALAIVAGAIPRWILDACQ